MLVTTIVLQLLLTVSAIRGQNNLCSGSTNQILKFSVGSSHNATGHHIISAGLTSGQHPRGGYNGTNLDVELATTDCGTSETEHLSATVVRIHNTSSVIQTQLNKVPPGYEAFPGLGVYRVHPEKKTWADAFETCVSEGAHLMVINSRTEMDLAATLCAKASCQPWIWLGFHDLFKEGHFVTVKGEPLAKSGYVVWHGTNPHGNGENCGCMNISGPLCDGICNSNFSFICERDG